jgi:hypothetical protein
MGDGRIFLNAGMETIIVVGRLVVGGWRLSGIMQMLLRGWRQSTKQQAKTYSVMHKTSDKESANA